MEVWKPVVGFEGRYEISDRGRVKSLRFRGHNIQSILTTTRNYAGYHVVTLSDRRQYRVHCLVLEAFIGPRPDGLQGCHNDDEKDNNVLSNLRWNTPENNVAERKPFRNGRTKIEKDTRHSICERIRNGESTEKIAKEVGVTATRIRQIFRQSKNFAPEIETTH